MKYEMMLVMKPIDDKKVEAIIEGVTSYINNYGTLIKVDNWGRKLLAYEIQGETEGVYVLFTFNCKFKNIAKLDMMMQRSEEVLRHMIVWKGGEILPQLEEIKNKGNKDNDD